ESADHAGRDAPAGGMGELLAPLAVLEADIGGLGEAGAEVMRGAGLERLAVLHHCLDRPSADGAGKALVLGLLASDYRERDVFLGEGAVHLERAHRLLQRVLASLVRGVAFLPEEFA